MNPWSDIAWLFFLMTVVAWILSVAVLPALVPCAGGENLAPGSRLRRAFLLASLPWLLPLVVLASAVSLALAKRLDWIADHCEFHGPGHPHLCFEHLPAIGLDLAHGAVVLVAGLTLGVIVLRFAMHERRMNRRLAAIATLARGRGTYRVLEQPASFAFAAGVRAPVIVLSSRLLEKLDWRERRLVLAHEIAHLRHGDPVKNFLFEIALLLNLPAAARELRRQWRQGMEERADDVVAGRYGRDATADVLLKLLRLQQDEPRVGLAAAGGDPLQRIRRLLIRETVVARAWRLELFLVFGLAGLALATATAHHGLETLLGHLTGY